MKALEYQANSINNVDNMNMKWDECCLSWLANDMNMDYKIEIENGVD